MSQLDENSVIDDSVRAPLLTICDGIANEEKEFTVPINNSHIIQTIKTTYSYEINKKMIELMAKVFSKLSKECATEHLERICEFYKSLLTEIADGYSDADQKVGLVMQLSESFSKLPPYFKGIHLAFL
jgi:hypothetical protein